MLGLETKCPKCRDPCKVIEGEIKICSKCQIPFQHLKCAFCRNLITFKGKYRQGQIVICPFSECQKRFQHVNCLHCKRSIVFPNCDYSEGKTVIKCPYQFNNVDNVPKEYEKLTCGKKFQQLICPHCLLNVGFKKCDYKEGQIITCPFPKCNKKFQQFSCIFCKFSIVYKKANYRNGMKIHCIECSKCWSQLKCKKCKTLQVFKKGKIDGKIYECFSCSEKYQHTNCIFCKKSIFFENFEMKDNFYLNCGNSGCGKRFIPKIDFSIFEKKLKNDIDNKNNNDNNITNEDEVAISDKELNEFESNFDILKKMIQRYKECEECDDNRMKEIEEQFKVLRMVESALYKKINNNKESEIYKYLKERTNICLLIYQSFLKVVKTSKNVESVFLKNRELKKEITAEKKIFRNHKFNFESKEEDEEFLNESHKEKEKKILQSMEKKLHIKKREYSQNEKYIRENIEHNKVLKYVKILIKTQQERFIHKCKFLTFLSTKGLLCDKTINNDYKGLCHIQRQKEGSSSSNVVMDIVFGKNKNDIDAFGQDEDYKMIKIIDYNEVGKVRVKNEVLNVLELNSHPSIMKINNVFVFEIHNMENGKKKKKIGIEMPYMEKELLFWLKDIKQKCINNEKELLNIYDLPNKQKIEKIKIVLRKVLEGIAHMHTKDIVHCDINPQNIFVKGDNLDVRIINFGKSIKISSINTSPNSPNSPFKNSRKKKKLSSSSGGFSYNIGSRYKSGDSNYSKAGDVYSYGKILFECIVQSKHVNYDLLTVLRRFKYIKFEESDILKKLLDPNANNRITALKALQHDFFSFVSTPTKFMRTSRMSLLSGVIKIKKDNIQSTQKFIKDMYEKYKPRNNNSSSVIGGQVLPFTIDRNNKKSIIEDFLRIAFSRDSVKSMTCLMKKYRVSFKGESGVDSGGLTRELFSIFCSTFSESRFVDNIEGSYVLPSDKCDMSFFYFALGRLFCRCFVDGTNLKIKFGPLFFSFLLGQEPESIDEWKVFCEIYDNQYLKSQMNIFQLNDFSFVSFDKDSFSFYNERGEKKILSNANKKKYILSKIKEKLVGVKFRKINMNSFKKGFFSCMRVEDRTIILNLLNGFEMEKLIYGNDVLSKLKLKSFIRFNRLDENINNLVKQWINESTNEQRMLFLRFLTGLDTLSYDGKLYKDRKEEKIKIRRKNDGSKTIYSHTCFYDLDVGTGFTNFNEFKQKMNLYLREMDKVGMEDND